MIFLKLALFLLPVAAFFFGKLLYVGLKRTYHTQRISIPGLGIWVAGLLIGIVIIFLLLFTFGFGIAYWLF
ncbi:hypothetical protein [Shimazuella kribbensis]|uniref:hypothetical protein n=1 Tax=Shimazuella kribbensis TaxID=139808 RepID=UPI00040ADBA3|nr:hypothetical protein [Shimazuella kribbensis]